MKLSIITINYNDTEGLKRTIESIAPHCASHIEYIVIDGGSTDGSKDVIESYSDKITHWVSEPDSGIFNAMNKGALKATGDYLLFINSGDVLNNDIDMNKITSLLNGEDFIYYDIIIVDTDGNQRVHPSAHCLDFKFFAERSLPHQATFVKRDLHIRLGGYNEQMRVGADWAFFLDAVCALGCSYKYINDNFSTYPLDGMSAQPENIARLWQEKDDYIKNNYSLYYSLYKEWMEKKDELYKLKYSFSVRYLKKLGFLKWLKL